MFIYTYILCKLVIDPIANTYDTSGSRDSRLGLWRIDGVEDTDVSPQSSLQVPEYSFKTPLMINECSDAKKVRALAYRQERKVSLLSRIICVL